MITRLSLENAFIHKKAEFTFGSGVTAITGPNESGKSLIIEMIRYGLFGSKALRGTAADYKNLKVEVDFKVNNIVYTVSRNRLVTLMSNNTPLAVGTVPVNAKIRELLGYDLTVFDIANACNQGMVEQLTNMRPAERKAMVDRTVGLDQVDELIVKVGEKVTQQKAIANTLRENLIAPLPPEPPIDYIRAKDAHALLEKAQEREDELRTNEVWLSSTQRQQPTPPVVTVTDPIDVLVRHEDQRAKINKQITYLQGVVSRVPQTNLTAQEIADAKVAWEAWDKYKAGVLSRDEVKNLLQKLEAVSTTCPECGHSWFTDDAHTRRIKARIEELEAIPLPPPMDEPAVDRKLLTALDIDVSKERDELATLTPLCDRSTDLQTARKQEWEASVYMADRKAWMEWCKEKKKRSKAVEDLQTLLDQEGTSSKLTDLYVRCKAHENDLATYATNLAAYNERVAQATEAENRLAQYSLVRVALKDLKIRIKSYLVPSLNIVASRLLERMTNGRRGIIRVDEDFDIEVDGQPIHTLSGSGKAVANLAIRIGLGQVLTNRMFSVFMGDEIDASMDEERAESTAECLRNLIGPIQQILLVSHKRPEADNYVEL